MKRRMFTRRLARAMALGLAVAAVAVPTAGAAIPDSGVPSDVATSVRPDDRATHGPGIAPTEADAAVRPDDRPVHGVGTAPTGSQLPSLDDLTRFSFDGPAAAPATVGFVPYDGVPSYSIDGPRSGPATTPGPVTDGLGRPLIPEAGPQSIPVADEAPSGGTDWIAVGAGAGAGLLLLLAAALGVFLTRRRGTGRLARA